MMWWPFRRKELSPVVRQTISLIERFPDQWTVCRHYASHLDGMRIWIPNGAWALKIEAPGLGEIFGQAPNCTPTHNHKALWKAIESLRRGAFRGGIQSYVRIAEERAERAFLARREASFAEDHISIQQRLSK